MNRFKIAIIGAIAAVSVTISVAIQHHAGIQLRERNEWLRQRAEELAQLSAENERLSRLVSRMNTSQPLSQEQLMELLRLRNEVGRLRRSGTEKVRLEATNAGLRAVESQAEQQLAEAQAAPNYWPKNQLSYAGYADPESALKSLLAAMNSGNMDSWRASCTPEAITNLEKEWKQHGLSPAQQEAEIKAMADMLISPSAGFHILDQQLTSPDQAVINLSFDGEGRTRKFVLKKVGNEWKFHDLILAGQAGITGAGDLPDSQ